MCVVSMIFDRYKPTEPGKWPHIPEIPNWPDPEEFEKQIRRASTQRGDVEKTALELFEELVALAKRLDKVLGLPDCEDPTKADWLGEIKERVRQHELKKVDNRLKKAGK